MTDADPELIVTHRFEGGLSWARFGNGLLECRSHALRDADGGIWLIDPFDGAELDTIVASIDGDVAGVIVLLDRHIRNAPDLAARLDVPLFVPPGRWRRGHARPTGAVDLASHVDGCPFMFAPVVQRDGQWLEWALWWEARRVLVVAEAIGTPAYYRSRAGEPLAVHPVLRVVAPPRALMDLDVEPELLLVGHGDPIEGDVRLEMELAVEEARRELPRFALAAPRHMVRWARAAVGMGRASC